MALPTPHRWWTVLAGIAGISLGSKDALRFLRGLPPPPFMGLDLSWDGHAAAVTTLGAAQLLAGMLVLARRPLGAWLGVAALCTQLLSLAAGWTHYRAWVPEYARALGHARGTTLGPEQVERLAWMLPGGTALAGVLGTLWLVAVARQLSVGDY